MKPNFFDFLKKPFVRETKTLKFKSCKTFITAKKPVFFGKNFVPQKSSTIEELKLALAVTKRLFC